jgi:hypothetical protein
VNDKVQEMEEQQPVGTSTSTSSASTAAPSPKEPTHQRIFQATHDLDEKIIPPQHRSGRRHTELENESRLAASQADFDMAHGLSTDLLPTITSRSQLTQYPQKSDVRMGLHMGRPHMRQTMAFPAPMHHRQQHELALQDWITAQSPTEIMPMEYTFNGLQCQTQLPNQPFQVDDAALANNNRDMMGAGIPVLESMPYQTFPDHSRPLQHRTMSASHAAMLASSVHNGEEMLYHG